MFHSKAGLGENWTHLTEQVKVAVFPEFNLEVPTALCSIYSFYVARLSDVYAQSPPKKKKDMRPIHFHPFSLVASIDRTIL